MPLNLPTAPQGMTRDQRIFQIDVIDELNHCIDTVDINAWCEKYWERIEEMPDEISDLIKSQFDIREGQIKYKVNTCINYRFADVQHARDWWRGAYEVLAHLDSAHKDEWIKRNHHKLASLDRILKSKDDIGEGMKPSEQFRKQFGQLPLSVATDV